MNGVDVERAQFLFEHAVVTGTPPPGGHTRLKDRLDSETMTLFEVDVVSGHRALINLDQLMAVGLTDRGRGADPTRWGSRYPQKVRLAAGPYVIDGTAHLWPGLGIDAWLHDEGRFVSLTAAAARRANATIDYPVLFVARAFIAYVVEVGSEAGDIIGDTTGSTAGDIAGNEAGDTTGEPEGRQPLRIVRS